MLVGVAVFPTERGLPTGGYDGINRCSLIIHIDIEQVSPARRQTV